jgi:RNA polymerase sigma-70 factor (ECF subfamily)
VEPTNNPETDLQSQTVEQLVSSLRDSPEESSAVFSEIIRRFEPLLRRAWWRRGGLHVSYTYQDFIQEIFLRLFAGLPRLENVKAFPGYFHKVALSVAADYYRRQFATATVDIKEFEKVVTGLDHDILTGIFIRTYLERLSPREKEVINLEFYEGLSAREIAKQLGLKPGAVRMTKARALKRLRDLLAEDSKTLEDNSAKR